MKATRQQPEPAFVPVTLILETQEEVDAFYGLYNHTHVCDVLGLRTDDRDSLRPFTTTEGRQEAWKRLARIVS